VVEARSKLPQYAYGKRIIFMDKEAYVIRTRTSTNGAVSSGRSG